MRFFKIALLVVGDVFLLVNILIILLAIVEKKEPTKIRFYISTRRHIVKQLSNLLEFRELDLLIMQARRCP